MAIKYLAGERIIGTAAERAALTTGLNLINTGDAGTSYNAVNNNNATVFKASSESGFGRCIEMPAGSNHYSVDPAARFFSYDFASSQNWIGSGDYCVGAWGKLIDTNGDQEIIDLRTEGTNNYIKIYHWGSNKFRALVYLGDGSGYDYITSGNDNANDGGWHHLMIERSSGTHTLYIDNSSVDTWSNSGTFGSFNQIRIGRWWEGEIDECFVLTRTATSAEKTSMQSGVISGISSMYSDSDLKLYYNCDNTIAYPNLTNGTIFEESDTGKIYMFDGTSAWNEM